MVPPVPQYFDCFLGRRLRGTVGRWDAATLAGTCRGSWGWSTIVLPTRSSAGGPWEPIDGNQARRSREYGLISSIPRQILHPIPRQILHLILRQILYLTLRQILHCSITAAYTTANTPGNTTANTRVDTAHTHCSTSPEMLSPLGSALKLTYDQH